MITVVQKVGSFPKDQTSIQLKKSQKFYKKMQKFAIQNLDPSKPFLEKLPYF